MNYLWAGALLFAGPHQRDSLAERLGSSVWKLAYAAVILLGLVFFILAYRAMGDGYLGENLYEPWAAGRHLLMVLALVAFILIGASYGKGYIKSYVRHPMSLGILLWSGGHLLVNGERAVVWLFGSLFVVALVDLVFSFARGKSPDHVPRLRSDIAAVVIGLVLYGVFLFGFHPYVLGVPVIG
jgi:uncharacterized membrane protein